jgi:hypothetical protein
MYNTETTINGTAYNSLSMPSAGYTTIIGKPAVPMVTRFLEVPDNVNINVEVVYSQEQTLEGFNVIPAQEYPADYSNASQPPFVIDETTYKTDAFYPSEIASVEGARGADSIIVRGHRIVPLSLYPAQFNPVTKQLRVYSKIEVRLNYDVPGQVGPLSARLASSSFETLLEALVLNYQNRSITYPWQVKLLSSNYVAEAQVSDPGAEYLIITDDAFYEQAKALAAWKEQKGLTTRIVNTTQINPAGPTANDITTYIQNAYNKWSIAPTYLLLLGDSEFIPPHYRNPHPSPRHGGFDIPTDLYYATVDGTDYFPDIYVGRLSVDTVAQATITVNKILEYERHPPTNAAFYTHASACAYFQDDPHWECGNWYNTDDGYEDRRFVLTSEEIRDYMMTQGYTVDRIYTTDAGINPRNYSICQFDNGDPIPADLLIANGFAWSGNAADITNSITGGRLLVYHRNHGGSTNCWDYVDSGWVAIDGWGDPLYEITDVAGLTNGQLLPVVFSVECQCGWFDGEVDQLNDPRLTRNVESLCEELVRQANGGAIAAIGATRNSASGYNDDLIKGFVDALWPGFNLSFASGGLYNLGQVLTYGKVYMSTIYGYNGDYTNATFEVFHLFGDPELSMWTEQPRNLAVSHPQQIGSNGVQKFVVNVTDQVTGVPVDHVKVCLQKESEVYEVAYTDPAGGAYFSVYPLSGGEMKITATKHNYQPYEGSIAVTNGGAVLSLSPDVGPSGISMNLQGSKFDGNEQVDIYFGGQTVDATYPASAGSFTATFTVPTGQLGPVNVVAVGTSGRRAVAVFRRLPDQPLPDPYIYDQWDSSTWHLNSGGGDPRWNNPCIQLYDATSGAAVSSNDLTVGTTYTVKATIYNDATAAATDTVVTFTWAFWGGGQKNWYTMGSPTVTVPANGGQATAEIRWTPSITGHTCIQASIYHPWDENLNNNLGQENTDVHPVASPGEITFTVCNPTEKSALVYIEAKQVGTQKLWQTRIERDYPQVQAPGENKTVTLVVEAPSDVAQGENRTFTVSGYVDGKLIGGIEVEVVVERGSQTFCPIILILVILFIIIIVLLIRRRSLRAKIAGLLAIIIAIVLYLLHCILRIGIFP